MLTTIIECLPTSNYSLLYRLLRFLFIATGTAQRLEDLSHVFGVLVLRSDTKVKGGTVGLNLNEERERAAMVMKTLIEHYNIIYHDEAQLPQRVIAKKKEPSKVRSTDELAARERRKERPGIDALPPPRIEVEGSTPSIQKDDKKKGSRGLRRKMSRGKDKKKAAEEDNFEEPAPAEADDEHKEEEGEVPHRTWYKKRLTGLVDYRSMTALHDDVEEAESSSRSSTPRKKGSKLKKEAREGKKSREKLDVAEQPPSLAQETEDEIKGRDERTERESEKKSHKVCPVPVALYLLPFFSQVQVLVLWKEFKLKPVDLTVSL